MVVIIIVLAIALVLFTAFGMPSANAGTAMQAIKDKYRIPAIKYGVLYGIPFDIILAMIQQESSGNPLAKGSIGERGLMQLTPPALQDVNAKYKLGFSFDDMYDAEKNIQAGTAYLAICRAYFYGDLQKAIQAYNAGMGTVSKNPQASIAYYNSVMDKKNYA
ncbi:MAG: transglycosylase SLT domain-containing protein [Chitinophagaceae bacterium]